MKHISLYPISPLLNGFDGVISAAGYNSFHELLTLTSAPILFAPNRHARLDDQYARAKFAAKQGWADVIEPDSNSSVETQLGAFLDIICRKKSNRHLITVDNGATTIAALISGQVGPFRNRARQ